MSEETFQRCVGKYGNQFEYCDGECWKCRKLNDENKERFRVLDDYSITWNYIRNKMDYDIGIDGNRPMAYEDILKLIDAVWGHFIEEKDKEYGF